MVNEEVIARLVGKLTFDADLRGIKEFEARIQHLQKQVEGFRKVVEKKFGIGRLNTAPLTKQLKQQQALTKAQFADQMKASKFSLVNAKATAQLLQEQQGSVAGQVKAAKQTLGLAKAQTQLSQEQTKQALLQAKLKKADLQYSLQSETIAHRMRQQAARTVAAEARSRTAIGRAEAWLADRDYKLQQRRQRDQQRLQRQQQRSSSSSFASGFGGGFGSSHRLPHFGAGGLGSFAGRMSVGPIVAPSMVGLAGAAGGATVAIAAMAAAAVAASTAFAEASQKAGDTRDIRLAQFKAMTGSREGALAAEGRYLELANRLGLNAAQGGRDYAKFTGALAQKVGVEKAENTSAGILSYAKSQGSTGEEIQLLNRGLLQALGKNQLFSEEWTGQIAEHLGANASKFGAEAYQRAIGGTKTGQAAEDAFRQAREDGKITGKALQNFLLELGNVLGKHANDGGALDVAVNTGESAKSRFENQMQANLANAYDANDQKLRNHVALFNKAKFELLQGLGPQFDQFGSLAADVLEVVTSGINKFTEFVRVLNSGDLSKFFDDASLKEFMASFEELTASFEGQLEQIQTLWSAIWGDTTPKDVGSFVLDVLSKVMDGMATVLDISSAIIGVVTDIVEKIRAAAESLGIIEKRKAIEDGISGDTPRIQGQSTPIPRNEGEANTIPRGLPPNLGEAVPRAASDFIPKWMQHMDLESLNRGAESVSTQHSINHTENAVTTVSNIDNSSENNVTQNINVTVSVPDNVAGLSGVKSYIENELPNVIKEGAQTALTDMLLRAEARQKDIK